MFYVFLLKFKNMFYVFYFFDVFLYFFNFVFLLSLKQKRTKLQISCISHGQRLHFLDRASVLSEIVPNFGRFSLSQILGAGLPKVIPILSPL